MTRWFLPNDPDLLGRLGRQAELARPGGAWRSTTGPPATRPPAISLRAIEDEADQAKRELFRELRLAFSPPIDGEDLFVLGQGFENIINQMKNVVREAEVLELPTDEGIAEMADRPSSTAWRPARTSRRQHHRTTTRSPPTPPTLRSSATTTSSTSTGASCRRRSLDGDVHEVMGKRELYRRLARLGEAISAVAERVWYAVIKEG